MDNNPLPPPQPHRLSPSSSGRRRSSSDSNSPEFEFWMLRNPSFPQPNLLSADELFSDGVLLPLHLLPQTNHSETEPPQLDHPEPSTSEPPVTDPEPEPGPGPELTRAVTEATSVLTGSKRWKDIFKKSEKKSAAAEEGKEREKDKEKKREKKSQIGASSAAELNIHIWPFSRSRSAGNTGTRPRMVPGSTGSRKVSSAPCSRSNSAGESKSRKWPSSPGRTGVHLGRSSPVWQVRRAGSGRKNQNPEPTVRNAEKLVTAAATTKKETAEARRSKAPGGNEGGGSSGGAKVRVLNLNVPNLPMCIGYRHHFSCRSNENSAIRVGGSADGAGSSSGGGSSGGNMGSGGALFNLRNLFTKKVY